MRSRPTTSGKARRDRACEEQDRLGRKRPAAVEAYAAGCADCSRSRQPDWRRCPSRENREAGISSKTATGQRLPFAGPLSSGAHMGSDVVTAFEMANAAGIDPRTFRAALRKQGFRWHSDAWAVQKDSPEHDDMRRVVGNVDGAEVIGPRGEGRPPPTIWPAQVPCGVLRKQLRRRRRLDLLWA